jgi:hypothetical protein
MPELALKRRAIRQTDRFAMSMNVCRPTVVCYGGLLSGARIDGATGYCLQDPGYVLVWVRRDVDGLRQESGRAGICGGFGGGCAEFLGRLNWAGYARETVIFERIVGILGCSGG